MNILYIVLLGLLIFSTPIKYVQEGIITVYLKMGIIVITYINSLVSKDNNSSSYKAILVIIGKLLKSWIVNILPIIVIIGNIVPNIWSKLVGISVYTLIVSSIEGSVLIKGILLIPGAILIVLQVIVIIAYNL